MTRIVEILLLPPFNLLILAAGGLILARYYRRWTIYLTVAAIVLLYVFSTPLVSGSLRLSLGSTEAVAPRSLNANAGAIVILGGGMYPKASEYGGNTLSSYTLVRVRYGAYLYRLTEKPILVTGGDPRGHGDSEAELMARVLEKEFSTPVAWIEPKSNNTWENALYSEKILREAGIDTIYLVTHGFHMWRAKRAFEKAGLKVVPAPTMVSTPDLDVTVLSFIPTAGSLSGSARSIRELLGRAFYAVRD